MTDSVKIGIGVVALAVAGFLYFSLDEEDDPKVTCKVGVEGLKKLAQGYHAGDEVGLMLSLAPPVCEAMVRSALRSPTASVDAIVEIPSGETTEFSGSAEEFLALAPAPEPAPGIPDLGRMIDCISSYPVEFLYDDCVAHRIDPF